MIPIGKRYNTPHRSHVVKTRMTEEEYADFTERLKNYDMSQAEFIRQAITRATIRPIVTVSPVNDELLSAVGKLIAEYGKIGGNLNQIARALNEYGTPYNTLSVEWGGDLRKHLCRSRCSVMLHRLSLFFGLLGIVPLLPQNQMHQ